MIIKSVCTIITLIEHRKHDVQKKIKLGLNNMNNITLKNINTLTNNNTNTDIEKFLSDEFKQLDKNTELFLIAKSNHESSRSTNATIAYTSDLRNFLKYAGGENLTKLKLLELEKMTYQKIVSWINTGGITEVVKFLNDFYQEQLDLGKSRATINRYKASLTSFFKLHALKNFNDNIVIDGLFTASINSDKKTDAKKRQKKAFEHSEFVEKLNQEQTNDIETIRNQALVSLGYICGLRRSELVNIEFDDFKKLAGGLEINIKKAKSGKNQKVLLPFKTDVKAYQRLSKWLDVLRTQNITTGNVFRSFRKLRNGSIQIREKLSDRYVGEILKQYFDDSEITAHSLRISMITHMSKQGKTTAQIKQQSRHKTDKMILDYSRMEANDVCNLIQDSFNLNNNL